jgi:PAS domain S-box-containing protein
VQGEYDTMVAIIFSAASLIVQAYTVFLAIRLVAITRHRLAWGSIALGMTLIMIRRVFELAALLNFNDFEPNFYYTLISFAVSACMAVGMHLAKKMIDRMLETAERLTVSEAYYRGLMEFGTEAIFVADKDGHYISANHRGLELVGYTADQLSKLSIYNIFDPESVKRTPIRWEEIRNGKLVVSIRSYIRADGTSFVGEMHSRQLPDGNLMSSVRDITPHIVAEKKLEFQANLLDTVQQAVVAFDLDGKITYYNEYAVEMYGWKGRDILGQLATSVIETNVTPEIEQRIENCLVAGNRWTGEVRYMDVQGNWSPAMLIRSPLYDQHHVPIGSIGISFDLSDLQEAEQAAARAENLLREFIDTAPFGAHHYELTPDGQLIFSGANQTAERILHFDHNTIVGKRIEDAFPSHLETPIPEIYRSVALTGVPWESSQVRYTDGMIDGAYEVSAFQTGVNRMVALFKDVTDRVRAEEALRQREIRLQTINDVARGITSHEPVDSIVDRALISIFQAYPQYLVAYADVDELNNVKFRRSLQPLGRNSLTGRQVNLSEAPEFLERLRRSEIIAISSGQSLPRESDALSELPDFLNTSAILTVPMRLNGKLIGLLGFDSDKETTWTEYEMKLLLEVGGYLEIAYRDAYLEQLRVSAEESLRASDERFRMALHNSPIIMFHQDLDLRYTWNYNSRDDAVSHQIVGKTDHELLPSELADRLEKVKREVLSSRTGKRIETNLDFMGQTTYWDCTLEPMFDRDGMLIGIAGVSTNITDRKKMELELRASEERFRTLAENLPSFIWTSDPTGQVDYFNRPALEAAGYSMQEMIGYGWLEMIHPEDRPEFENLFRTAMSACMPFETTIRFRRKDGTYRHVMNYGVPHLSANGELLGYIGSCVDLTDRLESEKRFRDQNAQLNLAMQIASSGTFEYDIVNNRLIWSEEMQQLYGIPVGSFRGEFSEWTDRLLPEERQQTLDALAKDVAHGSGMNDQFRITRQDTGEIRWIEARGEVQYDQAGAPIRVVGVNTDITELKRVEDELKHSESLSGQMRKALFELNRCDTVEEMLEPLLTAAFEIAEVQAGGVYLVENDMAVLRHHRGLSDQFVAAVAAMPLSVPHIKMVLESDKMVYLPNDVPDVWQLCNNDGITHIYAMPLKSGRGDIFGFLNLASHQPEPPNNQNIRALEMLVSEVGIVFHRLRAEADLESELIRRKIFIEQSLDGIVVVDRNGKVFETNSRFVEMLGRSIEEVQAMYVWDWDKQLDRDKILDIIHDSGSNGIEFETVHERKDGTRYEVEISISSTNFGGEKLTYAVVRDISVRKRAEKALRESEARLAQAQRLASLGSYEFNLVTKEAVFSDEVFRILGYEPGSIQPSIDLFTKHIQSSNCIREQAILPSQNFIAQTCDFPCRMIRADGVERFVRTVSHPIYDAARKLQSVIGMIQDVTEQHVAQAALKESEAHYRAIADFTYDWEFWQGADGILIYVSPSCARITGYSPQEFMSDPTLMERIIHPEDLERYREHVHGITEGGELATLEFRIIVRSGEERWVGHVCRPIHDRDGQYLGVRGSNTDITEQKQAEADRSRLEEQLRLAQKLETIGTMAAGIAHDFNNLLVPIIGYTELISSETLPGKFSNEYMQEVLKAAYRAKGLVAHILAFSRQQSGERKPVQIESVIADVVSMLTKTVDSNIQIRFQTGSTTAPVLVDPGQMVQVIMNLCENAVQAMADGGELTIESALFEASPNTCPHCKRRLHGKTVLITVRDTGCGMDDATRKRIFDPFFTTKGVGKGTGMGLAVTHGIVTQHSGHICASSALGQGSTFHLYLPVAEAIQPVLAKTLPQAICGGTERILVIDDEPSVANSQAASLSSLGYRVTVACDPRVALTLFEEKPLDFDCVLLDQRMPELSGDMVAVQLLRIRPDIPIVICSGFSDSLNMRSAQDLGIRDVIMKPIIAADLNRSIRAAIAGTRPVPTT